MSAHTTHLVGSALSDPYLSFCAGMCGLAGPLHGLANQEVLVFLEKVVDSVGLDATDDQMKRYQYSTVTVYRQAYLGQQNITFWPWDIEQFILNKSSKVT